MICKHKVCTKAFGCLCKLTTQKADCKGCIQKTPMSLSDAQDAILIGGYDEVSDKSIAIVRDLTNKLPINDRNTFDTWYNSRIK